MNSHFSKAVLSGIVAAIFFQRAAAAEFLDAIGMTVLRATTTNLNGMGVRVGQVEASVGGTPPAFEVNPALVGQPISLFTYYLSASPYVTVSSSSVYPNSLGQDSAHADNVANNFFGMPGGVATNVLHMNNYEANGFINYYIAGNRTFTERIINQSFTFGTNDESVNQLYDDYAAAHKVLFVNGAGFPNSPVWTPGTIYNGIGVGVYGPFNAYNSTYGPTVDGRSKPDICAPLAQDAVASYSTPQVSGAAALLMQAGGRGDGGSDTNSAMDIRTLKALLLNGALKPVDWTNSPSAPLHTVYGAGVVNVFNAYKQLAGGKQNWTATNQVSVGVAHPPIATASAVSVLSGWNFSTNSSSPSPARDTIHHYFFNVTNSALATKFNLTATLVWNRQQGQSAINNLDLFLYDAANSNLVLCSTSRVDNVEHLRLTNLPAGRYDLQVWKAGGSGIVSAAEPYALAWEIFSQKINFVRSGTNLTLTWPVYPAGFALEATTNLPAGWSTNGIPPVTLTNGLNSIRLNLTNGVRFFRLRQPNL